MWWHRYYTLSQTVICNIVSLRLDSCDSLFAGMSKLTLIVFWEVQNTFACIVASQRKFDHTTPILKELHWLPVRSRVTFKVATLAFQVQTTGQKRNLAALIVSAMSQAVTFFRRNSNCWLSSNKAFSHMPPSVWNTLPLSIRQCITLSTFRKIWKCICARLTLNPNLVASAN